MIDTLYLIVLNTCTELMTFLLFEFVIFKKNIVLHVPLLLEFKRHRLYHICSWVRASHEWFNFRNVSDSSSPLVLFRVFSMRCLRGCGSSWNAVSIPLPLLLPVKLSRPPFKCQFHLGSEDCFLNERVHLWLESVTLIRAHGPSVAVIVAFWSTFQSYSIWIHQCFCAATLDGSHSRLSLVLISVDVKIGI